MNTINNLARIGKPSKQNIVHSDTFCKPKCRTTLYITNKAVVDYT